LLSIIRFISFKRQIRGLGSKLKTHSLVETLLLMNFLLSGLPHGPGAAVVHGLEFALAESNIHAVFTSMGHAVHATLHLTFLRHLPDLASSLHEVCPLDDGFDLAVGLDSRELDLLLHQLALLPSHRCAPIFNKPLISMVISLPDINTALLGHIFALGHHLDLSFKVLGLLTVLVLEIVVFQLALISAGLIELRRTHRPCFGIAFEICDIATDSFPFILANFFENGIATFRRFIRVLNKVIKGNIRARILQIALGNRSQRKQAQGRN